ncbi:MAG TPA: GAF domain-containing protein, partial [Marinagarivorans sp.]
MTYDSATFIAHLGAIVFSISLIFAFYTQLRTPSLRPVFAAASLMQSGWLICACYTLVAPSAQGISATLIADSAQQIFWLWALIQSMQHHCRKTLPKLFTQYFLPLGAAFVLTQLWLSHSTALGNNLTFNTPTLATSMLGLLFINRLYCSSSNIRLLKLICVALGVLFAYTAYHSITVITGLMEQSPISGARATVVMLVSLVLLIGTLTLPKESIEPHAKLSLSRPVILYICLFSLSAAIITLFAFASLYIRRFGGGIGEAMYLLIVSTSIIAVVVLLTSTSFRSLLNVLINKHLFSHKYDYRTEWLKLIDGLSKPANSQEAYGIALNAVMSIFKSPGGALYLSKGDALVLAYNQGCNVKHDQTEPLNSPFARVFRDSEWVFFPRLPPAKTPLDKFNETLPDWIRLIDDVWLVMPLIYETKLTGFIVLNEPRIHTSLNWEDLDLLKITGRQIASYIEGHRKSEALSEAKQFETFNKLSAFVMHDLKN